MLTYKKLITKKLIAIIKLVKCQDDVTLILKNHKALFNLVWCQTFAVFTIFCQIKF